MAKILKVDSKIALRSAVDLGIAMQLTNIARDVVEDSGRNRKYIDHDFIKIKETLGIAELFYKSSFKSIKEIDAACKARRLIPTCLTIFLFTSNNPYFLSLTIG